MSRTRKDEPSFVKAKKKGIVEHSYHCLEHTAERVRTEVTTEIFFANEVKQMEEFEAELAKIDATFTVEERKGYLVTRTGAVNNWRFVSLRRPREVTPKRVSVESVQRHPNTYSQISAYGMTIHVPHTVSDFDVFYVYTVTRTIKGGRNWGPRSQQFAEVCCNPIVPAHLGGGCSCCKYDDPDPSLESRSQVRDKMKASAKQFNYGGLDSFDDVLKPEDEASDLLPNLVYTSETPTDA